MTPGKAAPGRSPSPFWPEPHEYPECANDIFHLVLRQFATACFLFLTFSCFWPRLTAPLLHFLFRPRRIAKRSALLYRTSQQRIHDELCPSFHFRPSSLLSLSLTHTPSHFSIPHAVLFLLPPGDDDPPAWKSEYQLLRTLSLPQQRKKKQIIRR